VGEPLKRSVRRYGCNSIMKVLIWSIVLGLLVTPIQSGVSLEDRALLEKLKIDKSFTTIDRNSAEWLSTINIPKQEIYKAYLTKSSEIIKVFIRQSAGWEGQYTMTWCTVTGGRVTIVEAYFGDISGSGELQYVRQYQPEEISVGYFEKNRKCVDFPSAKVPLSAELCISYKVPSEPKVKVF